MSSLDNSSPKETLLLQDRLVDLGIQNPKHRELLLARLRRERLPGEALADTYGRCLLRWLNRWLERLNAAPLGRDPAAVAAAEATVALSGLAERWPLALFDAAASLPPDARRRLSAALPFATPSVVVRAMPEQSLAPVGFPALPALPRRLPAAAKLKA